MMNLLQDLRYAARMMRKTPVFTLIAIATLALGIGANTALFSVIDAVLIRPLPFHDPGRLMDLRSFDLTDKIQGGETSYPAFLDWRDQSHSFEAMSVWNTSGFTYTGGAQPENVPSAIVSANLFSMLGVSPVIGRSFSADEDKPGEQLPVILSFEFWQSHFGGDRSVIGRAITLDGKKCSVIGIMPARFQFPVKSERVELWTTIAHDLMGKFALGQQRGASYLLMIGRLKSGASIAQAQSDLSVIQERLNRQYPENRPRRVAIQPESDAISGAMRPALLVLLGAVGFVLLIACANVANLLLARAAARQKEFTVRSALGASRWTIIRQLLTESVLLSLAGAAVGVLLAQWGTAILVRVAPQGLARISDAGLDLRVLAFTLVVALVTGVLFGLAPAAQVSRSDLNRALTESSRGSSAGPSGARVRSMLVTSQLAIALVLLIGAGLLLRSFSRLKHVDPGFRADHVLTFLLEVPSERHPRPQRALFVSELLGSVRVLPGVKAASAIFGLPLADQSVFTGLDVPGRPVAPSERLRVGFRLVESDYFRTVGMRLVKGREFTPHDEQGGPPLAIVNETFARKVFPGEDPIGRRIKPGISFGVSDSPERQIVGVVNDVKSASISGDPVPEIYAPQTPNDFIGETTVVVRTAGEPLALVPALRSLVASKDSELPLIDVKTLDEYVSDSISAPRFETLLLGTFAVLAFFLTAIGLYGVISYSVVQRSREMGIRMALGAQRANILARVVREGMLLALLGTAAGLMASFLITRLMKSLLYGVGTTDPTTFFIVPVLLIAVALMASLVPARRATLVDPMAVLREE
ncbi:MAG TPA: ABC transporter permease [Candidatus Angelobacter sp.]|nr:ABC transporter permease [Candidatus Angelobacter sp.]